MAPVGVHGLHVDARLDGEAARRRHIGLREAELVERRAARHLDLRPHEIDPRHLFGDRVLDLQARIGLDEREAWAAPVAPQSTRNSKVPRLS